MMPTPSPSFPARGWPRRCPGRLLRLRDGLEVRTSRGVTLTELLVAMAVASVFFLSALVGFSQILRASEEAEAQLTAVNQARAAILYITQDLAAVRKDASTPQQELLIENRETFTYGDGKDNDGDGQADEDGPRDGRDGDSAAASRWNAVRDDRHAPLGTGFERSRFVGYPDLGDGNIDEDCWFGDDRLVVRIPPDPLGLDVRNERITYEIGSYTLQGRTRNHVLLRTVETNPGGAGSTSVSEPVAFNVLGLDLMAWNANNDSLAPDAANALTRSVPYWTTSWDARDRIFPFSWPYSAPPGTPPFEFPAAVYVAVTVYSGRIDLSALSWTPGDPIDTVTLTTTVDIEPMIKDLRYERFLRR